MLYRNRLAFACCIAMSAVLSVPSMAGDWALAAPQRHIDDLRRIEKQLYAQGYHRISYMRLESDFMTARALDGNSRPLFLIVAAQTGDVVQFVFTD